MPIKEESQSFDENREPQSLSEMATVVINGLKTIGVCPETITCSLDDSGDGSVHMSVSGEKDNRMYVLSIGIYPAEDESNN